MKAYPVIYCRIKNNDFRSHLLFAPDCLTGNDFLFEAVSESLMDLNSRTGARRLIVSLKDKVIVGVSGYARDLAHDNTDTPSELMLCGSRPQLVFSGICFERKNDEIVTFPPMEVFWNNYLSLVNSIWNLPENDPVLESEINTNHTEQNLIVFNIPERDSEIVEKSCINCSKEEEMFFIASLLQNKYWMNKEYSFCSNLSSQEMFKDTQFMIGTVRAERETK